VRRERAEKGRGEAGESREGVEVRWERAEKGER
jgi:hypothetical protein